MRRVLTVATAVVVALAAWGARADEARAATKAVAPLALAAPKSSDGVVNLNDATEDQLALLPGIGAGKAHAIAEHRRAHPFRRIDELTKVKGIGRKTFGRLRPYITTVGATMLGARRQAASLATRGSAIRAGLGSRSSAHAAQDEEGDHE
jgi:competence protein ComEA